jgi:superfamily II DNA or RNA helicase
MSLVENKTVVLEFDGSFCYINSDSFSLLNYISNLLYEYLSYEDKSLSYIAYIKNAEINTKRSAYEFKKRRFPTGLLTRVCRILTNKKVNFEVYSKINPPKKVIPTLPDWLYTHQVKAINVLLENPRGAISAPTGSGKTNICTYIVTAFPESNILITVPTSTLLKTTADAVEKIIGEKVGRVGGGKKEWARVTVGIVNSLITEAKKNSKLFEKISVCIQDEIHRCACTRYISLSSYLVNTYYCFGLSATIERADGKLILIEGAIGPTLLTITEKEASTSKVVMTPTYIQIGFKHKNKEVYKGAIVKENNIYYPTINGKPEVSDLYKKAIENNSSRDNLIIDILETVIKSPKRNGGILILVKGVEHGCNLSNLASERNISMPFLSGKDSVNTRIKYLNLLRNREIDSLCATSIFNEGEDIKPLEVVILACAGTNSRILIQQIGRVTRTCEGKNLCLVIDINDKENFYLTKHSNNRLGVVEDRYSIKSKNFSLLDLKDYLEVKDV